MPDLKVAGFTGAPFWIEGRNSPCVGATFLNVTIVDQHQVAGGSPPVINFMGDVEGMSGEIIVDSPHCKDEGVPAGNSLVVRCK